MSHEILRVLLIVLVPKIVLKILIMPFTKQLHNFETLTDQFVLDGVELVRTIVRRDLHIHDPLELLEKELALRIR